MRHLLDVILSIYKLTNVIKMISTATRTLIYPPDCVDCFLGACCIIFFFKGLFVVATELTTYILAILSSTCLNDSFLLFQLLLLCKINLSTVSSDFVLTTAVISIHCISPLQTYLTSFQLFAPLSKHM